VALRGHSPQLELLRSEVCQLCDKVNVKITRFQPPEEFFRKFAVGHGHARFTNGENSVAYWSNLKDGNPRMPRRW